MLGSALSRSLTMGAQGCGSDPGDAVGIRDSVDLENPAPSCDEAHNHEGSATDNDDRAGRPVEPHWDHACTCERAPPQDRAPSNLRRASDDTSEPSWSIFSAASTGSQGFSKPPRREVSLMLNRLSGRA